MTVWRERVGRVFEWGDGSGGIESWEGFLVVIECVEEV